MADVAGFFKKVLPGMASAVAAGASGNIPGLIVNVASTIGAALGKPDLKADPDAISAAVAGATPDQIIALRKQDQDFQLTLQKMGLDSNKDLEELAFQDRDSARKREMAVRDYTPEVGFYLLVIVYLYALHWVFKYPVPTDNKALVYTMLGSLGTLLVTAATYFYGTTRGSEAKTQLLAQAPPVTGGKK